MNQRRELKSFRLRRQPQQRVAAGAGKFDGAGAVGTAAIGHAGQAVQQCGEKRFVHKQGLDFGFGFPAGII